MAETEIAVRPRPTVDRDKCTGCGTCADVCPVGTYEIRKVKIDGDLKPKSVIVGDLENCLMCHWCETRCPEKAIQIIEEPVE